jgi:hypothetical protein
MLKKLSLIMSAILLIVAMSTLTACVNKNKSLHDIWDMKLASDGQTIEVFGLTSKGEKQATEGNGVFDFPTEVDGKTKFYFKAYTQPFASVPDWRKFNSVNGIIFDENFQNSNLSFDEARSIGLWIIFSSKQEQFLSNLGRGFSPVIFSKNAMSDFGNSEDLLNSRWIIFEENIINNSIVKDGKYLGYIVDEMLEEIIVDIPYGTQSITEISRTHDYPIVFGRYAKAIAGYKIPSTVSVIQVDNRLGRVWDNGRMVFRDDVREVFVKRVQQ